MTTFAHIKSTQLRVTRQTPAYWRVTIDNPPINVMGPEMVREFQETINALEADPHVKLVVFDSAVDGYFLNHSDFYREVRRPDLNAGWSHRVASLARFSRPPDARTVRLRRVNPRSRDGKRERDRAGLRYEFC